MFLILQTLHNQNKQQSANCDFANHLLVHLPFVNTSTRSALESKLLIVLQHLVPATNTMFTWLVNLLEFSITKSKQDEKFIEKADLEECEKMLFL